MQEFQPIPLRHAGADLVGQMALPAGPGPHPGVLVMYNAHGLGPGILERTARVAAMGYVAIATDMYGGGRYFPDPAGTGPFYEALTTTPGLLRARVVAWHDLLRARPEVDAARTAAIGFCFGGTCVLELARSGADTKAVVSYHGILGTAAPAEPGAVKAVVSVYTGAKDPYVPEAEVAALRQEMAQAGAHLDLTIFSEAGHSFTDPEAGRINRPGLAYDALADAQSWAGTRALLDSLLGKAS